MPKRKAVRWPIPLILAGLLVAAASAKAFHEIVCSHGGFGPTPDRRALADNTAVCAITVGSTSAAA